MSRLGSVHAIAPAAARAGSGETNARAVSRARLLALAALVAVGAATLLPAVGLGGAPGASAHDFLESTNPAADSTVTEALTEVSLTFNEPPLADATAAIAIEVHDPSGANIATGGVTIVDSTLSIKAAPTALGTHTVLWQTVSADGHAVSGTFAFDYEGPLAGAGGGAAPTSSAAPGGATTSTASPAPTASAPATPVGGASLGTPAPITTPAASAASDTTPFLWIGIGATLAVLVVVGAVAVVVVRRRRLPGGEGAPVAPGDPQEPDAPRDSGAPRA